MYRPPKHLKAILWDLDDTLCEYMAMAVASRREAFEFIRERLPHLTIDEIDAAYVIIFDRMVEESRPGGEWRDRYLEKGEYPRNETMRRLAEALGLPKDDLHARVSAHYHTIRRGKIRLFPDTLPTLNTLCPLYRFGLVTNGPADIQRDEIEVLGLEPYFDAIHIEGEFRIGKPDPAIFRASLDELRVEASEAIFVGNSLSSDIAGAVNTGIGAIWLNRDGSQRRSELPEPDLEIANLFDLCDWLGVEMRREGHGSPKSNE